MDTTPWRISLDPLRSVEKLAPDIAENISFDKEKNMHIQLLAASLLCMFLNGMECLDKKVASILVINAKIYSNDKNRHAIELIKIHCNDL